MREISALLSDDEREALSALEGLISREVGERLACLAADVPADLAIVEVGSYKGKSTAYLAAGARAGFGARVTAVDPWDRPGNITGRFGFAEPSTRERFVAQLDAVGLLDRVTPRQGFSIDAVRGWSTPIGLLYIDGDHRAAFVAADVRAWRPFLAPRSVVAFDDYRTPRNPGVAEVVDALKASDEFARWDDGPHPLAVGFLP